MRRSHVFLLLFVLTALASGLLFWLQADWWYYVGTGPDRWPKFKAPAWEQFVVSAIVGAFFGGVMVGVGSLVWWALGLRRTSRCN